MSMSKVKICGLCRSEDIDFVNEVKPDFAGFIINYPTSHRNISIEQLTEYTSKLDDGIKSVGVFVNSPMADVIALADKVDVIQLHGDEDDSFVVTLRKILPDKEIWKAFKITGEADLEKAMKCRADLVVLDNGCGTGETFDWDIIADFSKRFALAGGVNIDNVSTAIERFSPYLIDLSSGVETENVKDFDKMKEMIEVIRK